jgi:hypothetical protein
MFSGHVDAIHFLPTNSLYLLQECSTQIPVHCHESQEYRYFIMYFLVLFNLQYRFLACLAPTVFWAAEDEHPHDSLAPTSFWFP